ncbi:hypothetical protein QN277_020127 [Acacia crassicarpa]|uniref:FAD-binding PCMH-type domain-containing protein n=1 Tax=Acacia crassicarpa TaxID=499986 RepID=A0AAE1JNC6_9FABA|nr:hypothetical protein QN277_020127 [Acacia crassicarpa]
MNVPPLPVAILAILLSVVARTTSGSSSLENFLQCFPNHISNPSTPISSVILTSNNSTFTSLLLNLTSNRRYTTPTTPKPLAIVAAQNPSHVQATIICAKSYGLQIRIRSGGHDYEGLSYVSQVLFVVLDMFNLNSIKIDLRNETALVQAGATMGELYYYIAKESDVHGFPGGVCPTLGAGGHISGGGYGNLMRKYGLSVDNVVDAELVDVNGRILNRKTMGEDLFWAIRGGGAASFGVVLSWKIKLASVPPQVTVFRVKKTVEQGATDLVYKWQLVASELDNDLFIRVMPLVINETKDGQKKTIQVSFIGQFLGKIDRLIPLMNKSFPELGLKETDCAEMPWVNSTLFWYDYPIGTPIEELLVKNKQPTQFFKSKSDYVKEPIPKIAIESIWKLMIEVQDIWMQWNPYGGKMGEISSSETPFPHRAGNLFLIQYETYWEKEGNDEMNRYMNFSRSFHDFLTPYVSKFPREAFLNYRDLDVGANPSNSTSIDVAKSSYGRAYFKDNFERLVQVKTRVDPDNFFKHEQSIPPY